MYKDSSVFESKDPKLFFKGNKANLLSFIEGAPTPTMVFDKDGRLIMHNKSSEAIWDLNGSQAFGVYNILKDPQLVEAGIMPLIKDTYAGKTPECLETYYDPSRLAKSGRARWIKANTYPVKDEKGKVDGIVVLLEDITEQKSTSDNAHLYHEILKNFMNSVADALFILDENLRFIDINNVAQQQINKPRNEILGTNLIDVASHLKNKKRYKEYQNVIKTGKRFKTEADDYSFSPGRIVQIQAFKIKQGIGIIVTDITSAKVALIRERTLKRDLEILRDSALDLVEFSHKNDLYSYTANQLSKICQHSFVVINMLDHKTNRVIIKGIHGEDRYISFVHNLIGSKLIGKSFPYYRNHDLLVSGKLGLLDDGIYELMGGEINKKVCKAIEKTMGFKKIYTIGFTRKEKLYGNALIITYRDDVELNTHLIEAFINQISIAIRRLSFEKALFESEKKFEIAFEMSPDSIILNRLSDGMFVSVNEGFTNSTGYTWEDVKGRTSLDVGIWVDLKEQSKLIKELIVKGSVKNIEAEFRTKNGEICVGLMSAHTFTKDGTEYIISITHDITDRKKAEKSLQVSEERYRIVAKQTGQIVYDYNIPSGKISWMGAIEELTGFSSEEFTKIDINGWREMVHPDDSKDVSTILQQSIDKSKTFDAEYRFRRKDGEYVCIEEHGLILPDKNGKAYRMLGSMADITETKKYHLSLENARLKAQESDRLKTVFLTNISHEIRTPMNAILGFSELLSSTNIDSTTQEEYVGIINKSSHNLLSIINDIIDISMIETGQLQIYSAECSLGGILADLMATFSQYKKSQGKDHLRLRFTNYLEEENGRIISDEERIKQIMSNLIGNAIKYSSEGVVHFGCRLLKGSDQKDVLQFFVADNGIGIQYDQQEVIFERFRQLDGSSKRKYGGNGLGLSISRNIAKLLGGDLSVNSEPGKGSVFYFSLPYKRADIEIEKKDDQKIEKTYSWTDKKILVAEDEMSNFLLIKGMLSKTGLQIDLAKNGIEAVQMFNNGQEYDLILMDVRMPKMSGHVATLEIRKKNNKIPIIALSANAMPNEIEESLKAGCNEHLSKPIKWEVLLNTLHQYLN